MTYVVTVDTCIPEGTPEMDPLQRAGAVALIEDGFDSVRAVEGPDGVKVDLLDTIVSVHPGGALLKVVVDAPALEFAEDSVQVLVDELLERTELLADWTIERCEVELHQDRARASLDAAEGPDAPPDDPAARKARHTAAPPSEDAEDGHDTGRDDGESATDVRTRILAMADELRSFPLTMFGARADDAPAEPAAPAGAVGVAEPAVAAVAAGAEGAAGADGAAGAETAGVRAESARLAAGALVYATDILVEELFEDVQVLAQEDASVAECEGPLWHLERLPDRYALQYDARFARRFLVTVIALTTRFTDGSFGRLSCVAEEIALRFLLNQATTTLELHGLLDEEVSAALDAFTDNVYEVYEAYGGIGHEWLYDDSADGVHETLTRAAPGVTSTAFRSWFTPFDDGRYVPPQAPGEPEEAR
ncbi:hypothetical protein [Streptomyces sp. LUP30]|uniref:hypothetical protein n=1 Tax=Streptomyces sp. LUP30 TaxID=1890285 RepID=UPI00085197A8|nr:hypothetical protein [Streptomyces sp. LUP30]